MPNAAYLLRPMTDCKIYFGIQIYSSNRYNFWWNQNWLNFFTIKRFVPQCVFEKREEFYQKLGVWNSIDCNEFETLAINSYYAFFANSDMLSWDCMSLLKKLIVLYFNLFDSQLWYLKVLCSFWWRQEFVSRQQFIRTQINQPRKYIGKID